MYMPGIFVHEQVKALAALGVSMTVLAPVPYSPFPLNMMKQRWKQLSKVPEVESIDNITVYHTKYFAIPRGVLKDFWAYSYFYSAINLIWELHNKSKFDLIHAHGSLPDDHAAYLLSKKIKVPFVITVHGSTINQLYKKRVFYRSKQAILNADAVIGVSEKVVNKLKEFTGRTENVYKVLNGYKINDKIISGNKSSSDIVILFGGNMVESKGCEYLLQAFSLLIKRYDNLTLILAGGGPLLRSMIKLADKLGISNRTFFKGFVTHSEMLKLMSECDIFILPSFDEGFGIVYIEAMSFKKPVIGTEGEGITEIIKDGISGLLIKPRDVESIAGKLELLIKSESLRCEIGERGYQSIRHLTWEENANQILKIYKTILNS